MSKLFLPYANTKKPIRFIASNNMPQRSSSGEEIHSALFKREHDNIVVTSKRGLEAVNHYKQHGEHNLSDADKLLLYKILEQAEIFKEWD